MSVTSFKSLVVSAAFGVAIVLGAGASANAASPIPVPAFSSTNQALVTQVDYRGHRQDMRKKHRGPACTVRNARSKASQMGIRNARVIQRGKSVQVRGFRHGRPINVTFADRRGCPIIR